MMERISIDPTKMGGRPCIRDLRVTVSLVLGQLAAGRSTAEIIEDFPDLEPEDVTAALQWASEMAGYRELPESRPA